MKKIAILDRDGTLIKEWGRDKMDVAYPPKNSSEVVFMEGAIDGLKQLSALGYELVLVTNQSYLGTPRNPIQAYDEVMKFFYDVLSDNQIVFTYKMICPHSIESSCDCKKPKTGGMKSYLEADGEIDLASSIMFGDRVTDEQFASNLGVKFCLIPTNGKFELPSYVR
jgi:imidazoleglycerol-phosphate dehydratase / histidinol-phosphatase